MWGVQAFTYAANPPPAFSTYPVLKGFMLFSFIVHLF